MVRPRRTATKAPIIESDSDEEEDAQDAFVPGDDASSASDPDGGGSDDSDFEGEPKAPRKKNPAPRARKAGGAAKGTRAPRKGAAAAARSARAATALPKAAPKAARPAQTPAQPAARAKAQPRATVTKPGAAKRKARPQKARGAPGSGPGGSVGSGGGAASGAATTVKDEGAAADILLAYMRQENRPQHVQSVYLNMHGSIPKAMVQRALDKLSEPGPAAGAEAPPPPLVRKEYGKAKIYYYNQLLVSADAADPAALADLEARCERAKASREAAAAEAERRGQRLRSLLAKPLDADIERRLSELAAANAAAEARLRAGATAEPCSPGRSKRVREACARHLAAWKRVKGQAMAAMDNIAAMSNVGLERVMDMVGIDTDEDNDVAMPAGL